MSLSEEYFMAPKRPKDENAVRLVTLSIPLSQFSLTRSYDKKSGLRPGPTKPLATPARWRTGAMQGRTLRWGLKEFTHLFFES